MYLCVTCKLKETCPQAKWPITSCAKFATISKISDNQIGIVSTGGSTSYYELPPGAKELQDLIEAKQMNFAVGNIFKACYRLGEKSGSDVGYDLRKIIFFAKRELARRGESE